jgi:hypothetical protein
MGATVAAIDAGDRRGVYPVGSKAWKSTLALDLVCAVYLVGWLAWLMIRYVRRFGDRRNSDLP